MFAKWVRSADMENLPQSVIGRLRQAKSQPAASGLVSGPVLGNDAHLDADLLTAFAERSLLEAEREPVMRHLAVCHDCREVLALALPDLETDVIPSRAFGGASTSWFRWPVLQWGAVAAGILAVVMITVQHQRPTRTATALAPSIGNSLPIAAQRPPSQAPQASEPMSQPEARASSAPAARHHAKTMGGSRAEILLADNQAPQMKPSANELDIVKAKDPLPAQAQSISPPGTPAPQLQTSPLMMERASPRWAVTPSGGLQRSFDGGTTWEMVRPAGDPGAAAPAGNFLAVAASGLDVWAGGSAGMLFHTADGGGHWMRVLPSDSATTLTGDISRIAFSDPQHGSVSTSNHELWTTADGGQTWRREP